MHVPPRRQTHVLNPRVGTGRTPREADRGEQARVGEQVHARHRRIHNDLIHPIKTHHPTAGRRRSSPTPGQRLSRLAFHGAAAACESDKQRPVPRQGRQNECQANGQHDPAQPTTPSRVRFDGGGTAAHEHDHCVQTVRGKQNRGRRQYDAAPRRDEASRRSGRSAPAVQQNQTDRNGQHSVPDARRILPSVPPGRPGPHAKGLGV